MLVRPCDVDTLLPDDATDDVIEAGGADAPAAALRDLAMLIMRWAESNPVSCPPELPATPGVYEPCSSGWSSSYSSPTEANGLMIGRLAASTAAVNLIGAALVGTMGEPTIKSLGRPSPAASGRMVETEA